MKNAIAACQSKGNCSDSDVTAIVNQFHDLSNANIAAVQACIKQGDAACVQKLESTAATPGEVDAAFPVGFGNLAGQFDARQYNVTINQSVNGAPMFGTDVQQAQQVAAFRQANCAGMTPSACDAAVQQALNDRMTRVGVVTGLGVVTPLVVGGVRTIIGSGSTTGSGGVTSVNPNPIVGDGDLENVYSTQVGGKPTGTPSATTPPTPSVLQQTTNLLSSNAPGTLKIGGATFSEVPNSGNAAIFSGATDAQVQQYFMGLTGATQMPPATSIPGKGTIYVVNTANGNFTLRDFSTSSTQTGSAWTIDIPKGAVGTTYNPEIKFLRGGFQ
jgi:hypothetical protein